MKTVFLFTAILMVFIGIGCVSATDVDDSTTASGDTQAIETTTDTVNDNIVNEKAVNEKTITKKDKVNTKTASNYTVTQNTYSTYFDSNSVIKTNAVQNGSNLIFSGNIANKDFTFENIKLTVSNDGTSTLYNTTITVQNNAVITFDGIKIDNTKKTDSYCILLDSAGNTIQNSEIKINSETPVQAIKIDGDSTTVKDTIVDVTAPSSDVIYNADYSIGNAATSGIFIRSSKNTIDNVQLFYDGRASTGYFPSVDGVDIQSKAVGETVTNNIIKNSAIVVTGSNYVYGVNMGRSKGTTLESNTINVTSKYYACGVQLFDADTTDITGTIYSTASEEGYGIYGTAMGTTISQKINLHDLYIRTETKKGSAILLEGIKNATISDSTLEAKGSDMRGVTCQIDWMQNLAEDITIKNSVISVEDSANNILAFYKCTNVDVNNNKITASTGLNATFISTTKSKATDNYIVIDEMIGDKAFTSDEKDTVIKNNKPTIKGLIEEIENLTTKYESKVTVKPVKGTVGDVATLTATVVGVNNTKLSGGQLVFKINGKTLADKEGNPIYAKVTNGKASVKYTIPKIWVREDTTIQASYSGNSKHNSSKSEVVTGFKVKNATAKISISKLATCQSGDTVHLIATITDQNNNLVTSGSLVFKLNGKTLTTNNKSKITVKNGIAKLDIIAPAAGKTHNITAVYSDEGFSRSESTTTLKVTRAIMVVKANPVKTSKDTTTIIGRIIDKNKKSVTSKIPVVVKINGVTYGKASVTNGAIKITVSTSFNPGVYSLLIIAGETDKYSSDRITTTLIKS